MNLFIGVPLTICTFKDVDFDSVLLLAGNPEIERCSVMGEEGILDNLASVV